MYWARIYQNDKSRIISIDFFETKPAKRRNCKTSKGIIESMKRQILFRGWSESLNKWVEGDLVHDSFDGSSRVVMLGIKPIGSFPIPVHPASVGQFTGLVDRHKVKIFEGDIDSLGRFVEFSYGSFILTDKKTGQYALLGDCEFIKITGNTFKP
jgi:hypothetical protein